jgi:chemotaxis protein histidine kinase CheA
MSEFDDDDITEITRKMPSGHEPSGSDGDHSDEEVDHVDERWLVSYADMMTLLFGLFVLLYSMSNLDKAQAQKIIESTQEKFGVPLSQVEPEKFNPQELKDKIKLLEDKNKKLVDQNKEQISQLSEATKVVENLQKDVADKKDLLAQKEKLEKELVELNNAKVIAENKAEENSKKQTTKSEKEKIQKEKIQSLVEQLKKVKEQVKDQEREVQQKIKEQKDIISDLKKELKASERQMASVDPDEIPKLKDKLQEMQAQNKELEQKLKEAKKDNEKSGNTSSQAFLAVFINWSTKDHDIDLVIKDPSGKEFNFKKRKYPSHPGFFALDTRRGPGAELWQSDRIIPGKYTAIYSFYNQYGNTEVAKVSGTIYSPKGSFEIQPVEMDINNKKKYEISFDVNGEGDVKILNAR